CAAQWLYPQASTVPLPLSCLLFPRPQQTPSFDHRLTASTFGESSRHSSLDACALPTASTAKTASGRYTRTFAWPLRDCDIAPSPVASGSAGGSDSPALSSGCRLWFS